jgi:hypothetical protein
VFGLPLRRRYHEPRPLRNRARTDFADFDAPGPMFPRRITIPRLLHECTICLTGVKGPAAAFALVLVYHFITSNPVSVAHPPEPHMPSGGRVRSPRIRIGLCVFSPPHLGDSPKNMYNFRTKKKDHTHIPKLWHGQVSRVNLFGRVIPGGFWQYARFPPFTDLQA